MTVNTKSLRAALSACSQAADRKITLPILSCAKLEAIAGRLTVQSSNLDVWVERHLDCEGDLAPVAVNLKLLQQALEWIKADNLELSVDGKLVIKVGKCVTKLAFHPAVEFPPWPISPAKGIAVNCADLATGLDSVAWACAEGDRGVGRPMLENVAVILTATELTCVGFEGRTMAHFGKASICADYKCQIPAAFVGALVAALNEPHSLLSASDNFVICEHEHGKTAVKLSELKFETDWARFMANKNGHPSLRVSAEELKRACQNCVNFHDDKLGPQLNIDWKENALVLETAGTQNEDRREIELVGAMGHGATSLNASLLLKALNRMGEDVQFTPVETASFWQSGDLTAIISQLRRPVKK